MLIQNWFATFVALLGAVSMLAVSPFPVAAQALAELDTDGMARSFGRPPLPAIQPQVGPSEPSTPAPVVTFDRQLGGLTGYGYGSSPLGQGREIMVNADEMDARSTVFDLALVTVPEDFVFPTVAAGERWIRVDLGKQQVIAYEGEEPVRAFIVSTGLPSYPTVTGEFRIRMKVSEQTMWGEGYYLPGVKWVQYFYEDYGFHGTYWHEDFGVPKSHGCVNMTNADAKWLFDWAGPVWDQHTVWFRPTTENPGALVVVHE